MSTSLFPFEVGVTEPIVNVSSVRQLSPFRYPGGKTWLVPTALAWLRSLGQLPAILVDPFMGGGSVPLAALSEGLVEKIALSEIDEDVAAVWLTIFGSQNEALCRKILSFEVSREEVMKQLLIPASTLLERAFQTVVRNRTFRGGILANGASLMKTGENGKGVASRWYPETLAKRIRCLGSLSPSVDFKQADAFELIEKYRANPDAAIFVDPPYTAGNGKRAGNRLYRHNHLDHRELFRVLSFAQASVMMTYDDAHEVLSLAKEHAFRVTRVPMKSTHHQKKYELVITNR